ncbi:Ppx/GppA phosphatase family protein [Flavihumibacter profundi]|uniref:Ppx/GppA phosphatase family protein n=1 Tax=Flavihumibacter profundi TaxID=2716883 RepID=UPI001CC65A29|nr:exopolyphosphatase [Flavihumibacter profundi]MBZ5855850.1 exopolyphosphatase [Flavihumibacter profundi]
MKLAAIDIGSNAARLLITEVVTDGSGQTQFNKLNLVRVPLRLGFDVFDSQVISPEKEIHVLKTIKAYRALMDVYGVEHYLACATSAMRDATNAKEIIAHIKGETGVEIEVISGDEEASFIYENHIAENLDKDHSYMYIDVGGGSTELTFFNDNHLVFKESFNIGTIRLLKNQVEEKMWNEMKDFIRNKTRGFKEITCIGSGGNINKVFSMSKKKDGKPLSLDHLKDYYKELSSFTVPERMRLYSLREDRADVIVPALSIYINVMRWTDSRDIYVPKIGLADGLIHILWNKVKGAG